jgi:hypothetical protein
MSRSMMSMLGVAAAGGAVAGALVYVRRRRAATGPGEARALAALQRELFTVVQHQGAGALALHAADWHGSPILRRYPAIVRDPVVRAYLVDALLLLADRTHTADLDQLLSAAWRDVRKRPATGDRRDDARRERLLLGIRRGVLAMHRAAPEAASAAATIDPPAVAAPSRATVRADVARAAVGLSARRGRRLQAR